MTESFPKPPDLSASTMVLVIPSDEQLRSVVIAVAIAVLLPTLVALFILPGRSGM